LREVDALQREIEGDSAVAALGLRRALLQPRLRNYRGDSEKATDLRQT
jgi:hypothetical protein